MNAPIDPNYIKKNYPAVRPEWLTLHSEQVIDAGLPIVDPHHHLWALPEMTYLRDDLLADAGTGHNIRSTVFVDCRSQYRADGPEALRPVGETAFVVAETADRPKGALIPCAGIVAWADLRLGDQVQTVLEQHIEAGRGRFRGVRTRAIWHEDPTLHSPGDGRRGLLLEPSLQLGAKRVGALGLSLDVWVFHTQLKDVERLATMCPDTMLVLNHCGGPLGIGPYAGRRDEVFRDWRAHIVALAVYDNIVVKLGGLGMARTGFRFYEADTPPTSATLAAAWSPYFETCIQCFGAKRCMFESNFPVDKGTCSYPVLWNAFKRVAAGCSATEKAALFSQTAAKIYRL